MNINLPKVILVTGATGAVGPRVVSALQQAGYRIRTFDETAGACVLQFTILMIYIRLFDREETL